MWKISELEAVGQQLREQYANRESRADDVETIRTLKAEVLRRGEILDHQQMQMKQLKVPPRCLHCPARASTCQKCPNCFRPLRWGGRPSCAASVARVTAGGDDESRGYVQQNVRHEHEHRRWHRLDAQGQEEGCPANELGKGSWELRRAGQITKRIAARDCSGNARGHPPCFRSALGKGSRGRRWRWG